MTRSLLSASYVAQYVNGTIEAVALGRLRAESQVDARKVFEMFDSTMEMGDGFAEKG
jgi:hypothetical protein